MSAWIEIVRIIKVDKKFLVALLVSAWIEIDNPEWLRAVQTVALLVSAWIEMPSLTTCA